MDMNRKLPNFSHFSRRDFLKFTGAGISALALRPFGRLGEQFSRLQDFPNHERLGRVAGGRLDIHARPDPNSASVGILYDDAVVPWFREVVGEKPTWTFSNQKWVEIPDGYVYGAYLQPVRNEINVPILSLPQNSLGTGMWMEVTVPYVDIQLEREASSHSWISARIDDGMPLRLYYSQVFWVDQIKTAENGQVIYHINPNFYGGVDMMWIPAEALRPISEEDISPIHPDVENKRVVVDVLHQTLSCFEDNTEVYYCRVSTGAKFDMYGNVVDHWSTPLGKYKVSRKFVSLQMSGGTTGAGYDLPGIGWTSIFATGGVAIHSTFWHNNFGDPMSHGCVNLAPEDARWVFRWLLPQVSYDPGMVDITLSGDTTSIVEVREG